MPGGRCDSGRMGVGSLKRENMKEIVNILIEKIDFAVYPDVCRMMHVIWWNI